MTFRRGRYGADPTASGGSSELLLSGTIWVDPTNGTDTRTDLNDHDAHSPFATINAAVAVASAGDVIRLTPGTHTLSSVLTVPASVTIEGAGDASVIGVASTASQITLSAGSAVRKVSCPTPNGSTSGMFVVAASATAEISDISFISTPGNGYGGLVNAANARLICRRCRHVSGDVRALFGTSLSTARIDLIDCVFEGASTPGAAVAAVWSDANGGVIYVDRIVFESGYDSPRGIYLQAASSDLFGVGVINRSSTVDDCLIVAANSDVDLDNFWSEVSSSEDLNISSGLTNSANFRITTARVGTINGTAPTAYTDRIAYALP